MLSLMQKPLIGIVSNHNDETLPRKKGYRLLDNVVTLIEKAGGLAIILPYEEEAIPQVLDTVDGLVFPGGDLSYGAEWYMPGERPSYKPSKRAAYEIKLIERALAMDFPVMGLCLGMQILGCMLGGKLKRIPKRYGFLPCKHREEDGSKFVHSINIREGTQLHGLVGSAEMRVNSIHCEEVVALDPSYISAYSDDGVVEAIEMPEKTFVMGVQWHPEYFLDADSKHLAILKGFVDACHT